MNTVDTTVGDDDNNISCMVLSVSRADVKWDDLEYRVLVNGTVADDANVTCTPKDNYVSGGDTITVTYDKLVDKSRVKLIITYVPTGSTAAVWSVTCT